MTLTPLEGPGERPAPPPALLRLCSATAGYLAILRAGLSAIEAMAVVADPPEFILATDVSTPVHDLVEAVRAAVEVDDAPGTPTTIRRLLVAAMDEGQP